MPSHHYIKLHNHLQCDSPISFNPCLFFSCFVWFDSLVSLFGWIFIWVDFGNFCNCFPFNFVCLVCLHPCVVCMPLHVCVCPIVLRIFDSVYLNVSYRRSWKDLGQETFEVGPVCSQPFKHCFVWGFFCAHVCFVCLFVLADPCQQCPSAFLLGWTAT